MDLAGAPHIFLRIQPSSQDALEFLPVETARNEIVSKIGFGFCGRFLIGYVQP
jgi:hypothetical protein